MNNDIITIVYSQFSVLKGLHILFDVFVNHTGSLVHWKYIIKFLVTVIFLN